MEKKRGGGASRRVLYLTPQCPSPPFIFHLCPLEQLQSATKLVETLCPRGLSDVLTTDKGENKAFPPHPLEGRCVDCVFFKVTPLEDNVSTILSPIIVDTMLRVHQGSRKVSLQLSIQESCR